MNARKTSATDARTTKDTRTTPPAGRLAHWLHVLRWPVVIVWILATVFLLPLAAGLSKLTNVTAAAYLPPAAPSTRVALLQDAAAHGRGQPQSEQAIVIFARKGPLSSADLSAVASANRAVRRIAGTVTGMGAVGAPQRSADGRAETFTATVTAPQHSFLSAAAAAVTAIRRAVGPAPARAGDKLVVAVTGDAAVAADSAITTETVLLVTAVLIVAVILLFVYRSPVLWLLPLFASIGAIVLAEAAAHGLASAGLTVSPLTTSILIVLVFGAASDYALLLIHRYREELRRHGPAEEAMAVTLRTTLPTLIASAATVTGAMLCLLAAKSASLHGLGPLGAVAIVSGLLAETTLLPALLLVVGRRAFWPRVPRPAEATNEESPLWSGIGARVARHPRPVAVIGLLLLGAACAGLLAARTTNNPLSDLRGHPGSVTGAQLLAEHYPAGAIAPLDLLARPGHARAAAAVARATRGVAVVSASTPLEGYDRFLVTLSVPPFGPQAATAISGLRLSLDRAAPGSLVGGAPAIQYDIIQASNRDSLVLFPLVFLVILIVIGLLLRAIVAPLVLVATTGLSFAASFGAANLLWRYVFGFPGFAAQLPLYIFIFLVALGVDYNIFLSARVREEAWRLGTRAGTLRGLAVTGGVITAAGVVLAGTFAALAQLPSVSLVEVGSAVALGVLLDTLVVRTVIVPALLLTGGDRIWWPSRPPAGLQKGRP
jgi:RND superfamily putative drug exporter